MRNLARIKVALKAYICPRNLAGFIPLFHIK